MHCNNNSTLYTEIQSVCIDSKYVIDKKIFVSYRGTSISQVYLQFGLVSTSMSVVVVLAAACTGSRVS